MRVKQPWPNKTVTILVSAIAVLSLWATLTGLFSAGGQGPYTYRSIRGQTVTIYGKGLYKDMSAEVAPQGIAQDCVTLFIGVPVLVLSLLWARSGSRKGRYLLAGTLGYFLVTYLFYTVMSMYTAFFLVYAALLSASFYGFLLTLLSLNAGEPTTAFKSTTPTKSTGGFLVFTSVAIGSLWLSIVVPPLLNGTITPRQVEHYTTLVVQGLDLAILLPASFICGILWMKRRPLGYLVAPVYFVFLSLLMTALTAKVVAMARLGYNVIPVVFLIPTFNLLAVLCAFFVLKNVTEPSVASKEIRYAKSILQ